MRRLFGLLILALLPASSFASILTYDFITIAVSGSLAGESAEGRFSFDSSLAHPGYRYGSSLLSDLSFTWDGINYDETTANTGWLGFGASGDLVSFAFGTNCSPGICSVSSGHEQWYMTGTPNFLGSFVYAQPGSNGIGYGLNVSAPGATQVSEPAPLALIGCALVLLGVMRRKSRTLTIPASSAA